MIKCTFSFDSGGTFKRCYIVALMMCCDMFAYKWVKSRRGQNKISYKVASIDKRTL